MNQKIARHQNKIENLFERFVKGCLIENGYWLQILKCFETIIICLKFLFALFLNILKIKKKSFSGKLSIFD